MSKKVLKQWNCYVTAVDEHSFYADVQDIAEENHSGCIEFDIEEVSEEEGNL